MNGFSRRSIDADSSPSPGEKKKLHRRWLRVARDTFLHSRVAEKLYLPRLSLRSTLAFVGGIFLFYFLFLWFTLPDIRDPRELILPDQSSVVVDRNGVELYRLYQEEDRTYVESARIADTMKDAIIAIEDERFRSRGCVDIRAIARAMFLLGKSGGASTITRQLARNALRLKRDNIVSRKVKELILGCQLEARYTKDQLLELYLNWIPFGSNAYGIEQASHVYFNRSAKDLSLAQTAALAAIPQRPSYFSPYGKHIRTAVTAEALELVLSGEVTKAAQLHDEDIVIGLLGANVGTGSTILYVGGRADQVLRNMETLGMITETERLQALQELETIVFTPAREDIRAPHFVLWVRKQVEELFAENAEEGLLNQGGLTIETTLDWELQNIAENVIAFHREDFAKRFEARNMALVALDPITREILAYVGNADFDDEKHDGKVDMVRAPRQPGSSFKPIVYATAFEQGYGPATVLYDIPTTIADDEPQNFDGKFMGPLSIRQALGASRNIPAAKAFFLAGGEERILAMAARLGARMPLETSREQKATDPNFAYGWPLALGAAETPLLEMVHAYSTFAAKGEYKPVVVIRRITRKGALLPCSICVDDAASTEGERVLDERIAYMITSILSDTSVRPNPYWKEVLSIPGTAAAAKTGTSNKCLERSAPGESEPKNQGVCKRLLPSDLWTIGYTPALVAGVWVGNADSSPLGEKAESLSAAAPVWKDFLSRAQKVLKSSRTTFDVPRGIVQLQISALSGKLPSTCTPVEKRTSDLFLEERVPEEADTACATLQVDKVTGLLASTACPEEAREERHFLMAKSVLSERFPEWQQSVNAWVMQQMERWNAAPDHSGSLLPLPVAPTEECDPALTPGRLIAPELEITIPKHGGVAAYPSFQPVLDVRVGSTLREVRATLDGKSVASITAAPFDLVVQVPKSVREEGEHSLEVTIVDEYFNEVKDSVSFRFEEDRSPPDVRFTLPVGDMRLTSGGVLTMRAEAQDNEGGVKYVQFFLNERLLSNDPLPPYELLYPVDLKPGSYTLRVKATDFAGNSDEDTAMLTITQ